MKQSIKLFLQDVKAARWAIILIIAYFVILKKYLYSLCPLVILTGFPCPGCGLTRAGVAVLHLDFARAWKIHPFIFPIIILAGIFVTERYILQKKKMNISKWFAIAVMTGMIVFYIFRMLTMFPDVPPMTYYYHNILYRILFR